MPDWRGKDDEDMDDDNANRRQRGRRGHGRGSRGGYGDPQEFGGSDDFGMAPIFADSYEPRPSYGNGGGRDARADTRPAPRMDSRSGGESRGGYSSSRNTGPRADSGAGAGEFRPQRAQAESEPTMERGPRQPGTVKFFKSDKGFGFITPDNGETDVFVHISAVERSGLTDLESGQRLSFETEPDRRGKGPKAVELQLEEGGPA